MIRKLSRPERILVIDDNPLNRKLFTALLASRNYCVLEASNGKDGLKQARTHNPDLVILDLQLPDLSGLDVAIALKSDGRTRDIPVIAITAFSGDMETPARASGCSDFMTKPVNSSEFLRRIERLLQRVHLQTHIVEKKHTSST